MALDSLVTKSALDKTSTAYTARQPVEINRGTILLNYDSRYFDCTEDIGLRLNFSTDELTNYRFTIAVNGYRLSFVGIFAPRFESLAASIERKIATMTGQKFNNFSDALTYISNAWPNLTSSYRMAVGQMLTSLFGYYNCYIESTDDSSSDPARYVPIWVSYDTCAVWINNGSQSTNILAGIENAENISFSLGYCN